MDEIARAVSAITAGELVVYPTETVYGLGGDATNAEAIERVFSLKGRDHSKPLSVAVPSVPAVRQVARPSPRTQEFMDAFLPGPVTVVCDQRESLPPNLTGGRQRVGVRIPDHPMARSLLERTPPLTATSANPSGETSARRPADIDQRIRDGVSTVLDAGETPGTPSTVVDVDRAEIIRHGANAARIEAWLDTST